MADKLGDLIRDYSAPGMSRRAFIKRAAALGLSMGAIGSILAACGGEATPAATETPTAAATETPTATATAAATETATEAATETATAEATAEATEAAVGDTSKGVIKIYTSWPHQGAMIPEGKAMSDSVDMCFAEVNYAVAGYKIEIVQLDDASPQTGKWDGAIEAENANKAVADADCMVYLGTYNSGAAMISMPITNKAGLVQISPGNTYAGLTKKGYGAGEPEIYRPSGKVNYFRVCIADDVGGVVGADWALKLGHKKVYILDDQELYGKGTADVFEKRAKEIGLEVLGHEGIDWKAADFKPILTKIKASGADVIYMGGIVETGAPIIIRQMKEMNMTGVRFMGPSGLWQQTLIDSATPEACEFVDLRVTLDGLPLDQLGERGQEYQKTLKEKYGDDPTSYSAYSYDAALVARNAIETAGVKDRAAILQAVAETDGLEGILGKISFDENGDTTLQAFTGYRVEGGKFVVDEILAE